MLFRLVLLALGIYTIRQIWISSGQQAGGQRQGAGSSRVNNPMFYEEGDESDVSSAARLQGGGI